MGNPTKKLPLIERDDWLLPVERELTARYESYLQALGEIEKSAGSIVDYANGYRYFGWQRDEALEGWWFREWLPGAQDVYLLGDFNGWQRTSLRLDRNPEGVWSIFLPDAMYAERLTHGSLYKIHVHGDNGWRDRIPAYATRVVQDEKTKNFTAQFWNPVPFDWQGDRPIAARSEELLIYEAHVGMAQEREGVGSYAEFTEKILPRIREEGYDTVQLMGIAEHPYYGSFGYHVSNFFAPSSAPARRLLPPSAALRHARSAQDARAHGSRTGTCGGDGSGARPLREEPQRGDQRARRYGSSILPTGYGGRTALLGLQNFRLRQGTGAALPAFERQILARRVSFRRLSVRRGDLDDLSSSRTHRFQPKGTIFRRRGKRACPHLPYAGQYAGTRLPSPGRYDRRGGERHAGHRGSNRRRRRRLRLPPGHGHSGFLDPTAQGGTRRKVGHTRHLARPDRPSARHQDGRLCRIARPGAGGRPDPRVPADGKGDVRTHGPRLAKSGHRSRHGTAQDDPARHDLGGRGRLPQLHGQRALATRNDPNGSAFRARATAGATPTPGANGRSRTTGCCAMPSSGSSTGR